jgi:hypothetical protein
MQPNDAYDRFESEFDYPIDRERIIETAGDTEIRAPTGRSTSIGDILERADTRTFESPRELHETLLTHLGDQYIGRKFYDDRGTNVGRTTARTI